VHELVQVKHIFMSILLRKSFNLLDKWKNMVESDRPQETV